jgi:hypothetical protein
MSARVYLLPVRHAVPFVRDLIRTLLLTQCAPFVTLMTCPGLSSILPILSTGTLDICI